MDLACLNTGQKRAYKRMLESIGHHCVVGPPGTGKTFLMVKIVEYLLRSGFAVIAVAPKCSVGDDLRELKERSYPSSSSFFVDTLQGFICDNGDPSMRSGRTRAFEARLSSKGLRIPMYFPTSKRGRVIGIVGEAFSASAGQLDEFWECLKSLKTVQATRLLLEGDPAQLSPPFGMFASSAMIFKRDSRQRMQMKMSVLTLSERFRDCPTMLAVVDNLRDVRSPLNSFTLTTIYNRVVSVRQREGSVFLSPTHKKVLAKRKKMWNRATHRIKIEPVRPKHSRGACTVAPPLDSYIVKGELVMFTTNYRERERNLIIPNGTLATAVSWPQSGRHGFERIRADDEAVTQITVRLSNGTLEDIEPIVVDGWLQFPVTDGRSRTIHGSQGLTYRGTVSMDMTNSYNHRMLLMVMLSRVKAWEQIASLTGIDDVVAMGNGGPQSRVHDDFVKAILRIEKESRHRDFCNSSRATFICLRRKMLPVSVVDNIWRMIVNAPVLKPGCKDNDRVRRWCRYIYMLSYF